MTSKTYSPNSWERFGVCALLVIAAQGTTNFILSSLHANALHPLANIYLLCVLYNLASQRRLRSEHEPRIPIAPKSLLVWPVIAVLLIPGLFSALAPSDTLDWDTLAYHLAIPKLWSAAGSTVYIPYIHHSNFPNALECLWLDDKKPVAESLAKIFTVLISLFGALPIFGMTLRRGTSLLAGFAAVVLFLGMPVAMWEAGTGYVDTFHSLCAGLGIVYFAEFLFQIPLSDSEKGGNEDLLPGREKVARGGGPDEGRDPSVGTSSDHSAPHPQPPLPGSGRGDDDLLPDRDKVAREGGPDERRTPQVDSNVPSAWSKITQGLHDLPWLGIALIAASCTTKYTGLEVVAAVAIVTLIWPRHRVLHRIKTAFMLTLVSVLAMSPWLIRNTINTSNPVYPFAYELFPKTKNWSQWHADIYREEQQSFGVGKSPLAMPSAILGLGYQPGRYINPGPDQGNGLPMGAIGAAVILSIVAAILFGTWTAELAFAACVTAVGFGMWWLLSQQARYALVWVTPWCVISALALQKPRAARALLATAAAQATYSLWLLWQVNTIRQIPVVFGEVSRDEYRKQNVGFARAAEVLNRAGTHRVALYEEVFGYLLDVPYIWANPGHSTLFDYQSCQNGADFVRELEKQDVSHVYLNYGALDLAAKEVWRGESILPYSPEESSKLLSDRKMRYLALMNQAVVQDKLRLTWHGTHDVILTIPPNGSK